MVKFKYNGQVYNFFHLPKTAGTSISFAIQEKYEYNLVWQMYENKFPLGSQHLDFAHYNAHVDPSDINFTVVRDPVKRIVSLYKNFVAKDKVKYRSFTDWFNQTLKSAPHILKSQTAMLKGGTFRFFQFDNLQPLEEYFDIHLLRYNEIECKTYVTDNELKFINQKYSEDFQLLEYTSSLPPTRVLTV